MRAMLSRCSALRVLQRWLSFEGHWQIPTRTCAQTRCVRFVVTPRQVRGDATTPVAPGRTSALLETAQAEAPKRRRCSPSCAWPIAKVLPRRSPHPPRLWAAAQGRCLPSRPGGDPENPRTRGSHPTRDRATSTRRTPHPGGRGRPGDGRDRLRRRRPLSGPAQGGRGSRNGGGLPSTR
jgi:hypothetical protein